MMNRLVLQHFLFQTYKNWKSELNSYVKSIGNTSYQIYHEGQMRKNKQDKGILKLKTDNICFE